MMKKTAVMVLALVVFGVMGSSAGVGENYDVQPYCPAGAGQPCNRVYITAPNNDEFLCYGVGGDCYYNDGGQWQQCGDLADCHETNFRDPSLNSQMQRNFNWINRLTAPLPELDFWDAYQMEQGFFNLGADLGWWDDGPDGWQDDVLGMADFIETEFGQSLYDPYDYFCTISTDYDEAAEGGALILPGATSPSAWITGEVTKIVHPDISNPSEMTVDNYYRISLSVIPAGLTKRSGRDDCDDWIKFYVTGHGKKLDIDGDGTADLVALECDSEEYALAGSGARVFPDPLDVKKVCIKFLELDDLRQEVKDLLEDGDKICNEVVLIGEEPDIEDCGWCFPAATGEGGGIDLGLNWFPTEYDIHEGDGENRPRAPSNATGGWV